jgi:NADH pyrophosphatase NudC (nudix superfamily)
MSWPMRETRYLLTASDKSWIEAAKKMLELTTVHHYNPKCGDPTTVS